MLLRLLPALVATLALAAAAVIAAASADADRAGRSLLPDLEQEVPSELVVTQAGTEYRLGFRSAVRNVGAGPLIVDGRRGAEQSTMVADQVVVREDAPRLQVPDVGRLRFVVSPDHRHWHLLGFQHYTLRHAGGDVAPVGDRKTGFCLGDRYMVVGVPLQARAPRAVFRSRCGLDASDLLGIREGISVGYGDDYAANLEGQYLPLDGLPDGDYVLVHRVNRSGRIRESAYGNNVASLRLALRWRVGVPYVRVLERCPGSARCPAPPTRQETA
jgi:hypothetical protein